MCIVGIPGLFSFFKKESKVEYSELFFKDKMKLEEPVQKKPKFLLIYSITARFWLGITA